MLFMVMLKYPCIRETEYKVCIVISLFEPLNLSILNSLTACLTLGNDPTDLSPRVVK